ncbi:MAG: hypothetical protein ABSF26_18170 [Thermoguttaceae bacterium]
MNNAGKLGRRDHLTFKGNLRQTRYGWLRLTPAYSVHQVEVLLERLYKEAYVLDPFCGTGTTALVCAERGVPCDTTDINPFLVWLSSVKTQPYELPDIEAFLSASSQVTDAMRAMNGRHAWVPALHQIEKWWDAPTLALLGCAMAKITAFGESVTARALDLLKIAFCRTMMEHAHVSFGHQSMSFRKPRSTGAAPLVLPGFEENPVMATWEVAVATIASAARRTITKRPRVLLMDARTLEGLEPACYSSVITSPPYPNRMSYVRELRPYMFWLGFLDGGRAAGDLDWKTIGGTWGCATSNLSKWRPDPDVTTPYGDFPVILRKIKDRSDILSRYVQKYFADMYLHCRVVIDLVKRGGMIHYIVGNSKFYDVLLPVEEIYAAMFEAVGFEDISVEATRKRTSKKELYEFVVSARRPLGSGGRPKPAAS